MNQLFHPRRCHKLQGQTIAEYALVITMMAILAITVLTALGGNLTFSLSTFGAKLGQIVGSVTGAV